MAMCSVWLSWLEFQITDIYEILGVSNARFLPIPSYPKTRFEVAPNPLFIRHGIRTEDFLDPRVRLSLALFYLFQHPSETTFTLK